MNKKIVHVSALIAGKLFALFAVIGPVLAQDSGGEGGPPGLTPISGESGLGGLIDSSYATILGFMGGLAGALAVAYLIYGGILYIQGNAEAGKKIIVNVLIGVGIVLLAAVLVYTVKNLIEGTGATAG